jgi:hypothetical protein
VALLRALAGALAVYLRARGIALEDVAALAGAAGAAAGRPPEASRDPTPVERPGPALANASPFASRSSRLGAALRLLRAAGPLAFLDTVPAVGRTLEARALPLLLRAIQAGPGERGGAGGAGAPRAMLREALAQARAAARARIPQVPYVAQAFTARFGDRFRRSAHIFDFVATLPEQERLETILWMRSKGRYMAAGSTVFGALVVATGFAYTSGGIMTGLRDILPTERYDAIVNAYHAREAELPPTKLEISVVDGQATFDESTYWLGIADGNKELATWYQAQRWGEEDLKAARWRG